jgi:hypothetical protein
MRSVCDVSTVSMNEAKQAAEAAATDEWRGEQRQTDIHTQTGYRMRGNHRFIPFPNGTLAGCTDFTHPTAGK